MKITTHNVLAYSFSIFAVLAVQWSEARAIDSLESATIQRLESRAIRRLKSHSLRTRSIPHGIFHSCLGGGLSKVCESTIREGFKSGKLNVIKQEVQSFSGRNSPCKVTVWTDAGEIKLASEEQLLEAMLVSSSL
ncbi:hypothetical protein Pst134EA_017400 [Puccinia striiformis f. sp. tritici]|uniref:uncharacterized protein n=1 Tax=Puccinia striiformis f. sp. tritici TaxID=168172 RepID=UPI002007DDE4|nr:uncharacterized protein Pst134EA_032642 [Puccinia striiformis f. sp. tritici]XP_047804038.1 hypothetical protein Pst134EA_017400 [Puccinia striiformis f. sp. tritici]KAH9440801.1 hypothetical protein Pst134EA_032642 [Puccinia striiformis f. sp. tritici]KAH9450804.1 hypothetical protein Pst134EB_018315 [Puccinia striiformis f. sp. tritici]KAH9461091.1 hypothetical protein Pst134EA_017400 [Puccinia striiformis f. sp. tritici]